MNADDDPKGAAKPVAEKQRSCVEWMGDYMTDETKFFLDGAIWFGWAEYQPTTQKFELWFDEIAIDPERIGCVL